MSANILLVFDDFDPISNYKLRLVSEAKEVTNFERIIFLYESFKGGIDRVFQPEERIFLLSSSLPNSPSPSYLIDGNSFTNEKESFISKIERQKNKQSQLFLLIDSREYQILSENSDWPAICASVQIILYVLPEHEELKNTYSVASKSILFINPQKEVSELSKASILEVNKKNFSDTLIEYMNKSSECAIKRIKSHLSEKRFKHSLRVAGTIKMICETVGEEDSEFCYDAYMAAIYHDICKELPIPTQESIAKNILGIEEYTSWKVLHGPIASWYLRTKYLYNNEEVLEAIAQHTEPAEYPKKITMFIYLADKLEIAKKGRYSEEVYNKAWDLITEQKPIEAFNFLINYFHELRIKKEQDSK